MTGTGGELLVRTLRRNGADTVYCVPGESYIAVLDALYDAHDVRVITCRHEAGAANMADAYGKMTGRPGIVFVTRGPGATHASIGLHTAMQDSTPLICFVGQVARDMRGREAFQEIDTAALFGSLVKWAADIDDAARIPELVTRAYGVAMSGRPGPVVLGLPEDMLRDVADAPDLDAAVPHVASPSSGDLARMRELLARAQRPLVLLGGSGWTAEAAGAVLRFARRNALPVAAQFRRTGIVDNRDPHFVGTVGLSVAPPLAQRVQNADFILALGGRMSEASTLGYTLIEAPRPRQTLVHVHADPNELGRVYLAAHGINAGPAPFALALDGVDAIESPPWKQWTSDARRDYEAALEPSIPGGDLDYARIVRTLDAMLPEDAITCNGAGNFSIWLHRFYRQKRFGGELAPASGAMGYGVPAAVVAKLRHPERTVVAFAGDGDFLMCSHELATAVQYGAAIVVLVIDNGMYGTIRMHQERRYPGRTIATGLTNPDFAALARAYGCYAETVETTDAFVPAFERALASGVPAVLVLPVDPEIITPRATIAAIRAASEATAAERR